MKRKVSSEIVLTLVLICVLTLEFNIQQAEAEGTYNVAAHVHPLLGETLAENNQKTQSITPAAPSEAQVGVRSGHWIKVNYTVTGAPSGTTVPTWMKVKFLSVEGTNVTARVTMHMPDGTEQGETKTVSVVGGGTLGSFSGFVIPANVATGDSVYIREYGNITIAGETTRIYAGERRTVVYASFLHARARYYWDKQTGVLVEASVSSGGMTVAVEATHTNLWGAAPFWMQWWFWATIAAGSIVLIGAVYLKKRKPRTTTSLPLEATDAITSVSVKP